MNQVTMPDGFVATRYPGYFWNVRTQTLFTAKLGVLRQIKLTLPSQYNTLTEPMYRVSHQGDRKHLSLRYLRGLKPRASIFPVEFSAALHDKLSSVAVDLDTLPPGTRVRVLIEG